MEVVLAPLALLAVGIALFLMAEGIVYMLRSIASALGNQQILLFVVPLGDIFYGIIYPVVALVNAIASGVLSPIAAWLVGLIYNIGGMSTQVKSVLAHHADQITHLHNVTIPDEVTEGVAEAATYTDTTVQGVRTQVHDAYNTWENAHSVADAEQYLANEAAAPSVENAILAIAARALLAGENYTDAGTAAAEAYADSKLADAKTYTDQRIDDLRTSIDGAIAIPIGTALPSIDIADIASGAAVVTIGTAVGLIAAKIVNCLVSNCAGNNNFSTLLQDALGLLTAVEFAAFLESFVQDPSATLTSYVTPYEGIITGGASDVSDVWNSVESALGL